MLLVFTYAPLSSPVIVDMGLLVTLVNRKSLSEFLLEHLLNRIQNEMDLPLTLICVSFLEVRFEVCVCVCLCGGGGEGR